MVQRSYRFYLILDLLLGLVPCPTGNPSPSVTRHQDSYKSVLLYVQSMTQSIGSISPRAAKLFKKKDLIFDIEIWDQVYADVS